MTLIRYVLIRYVFVIFQSEIMELDFLGKPVVSTNRDHSFQYFK